MAVHLASAPTAIHNPMNQYSLYTSHAQMPLSSTRNTTPTSLSPVSPQNSTTPPSTQAARQLRPPRVPTYIPAVLRPTDNPSRRRPNKSLSSNSITPVVAEAASTPLTPPDSADSSLSSSEGLRAMGETLQQRIMASEGITRIVTDEWNDDGLENVTGAPTRDHWKPDSSSPSCDSPICSTPFSLLNRRHHCRRCGNIFCYYHSSHNVPLDQHARFHPDGVHARACESCWADYVAWKRRRSHRLGSAGSSDGSGSGVATPIPRRRHSRMASSVSIGKKGKDLIVGSIPRDWNWSTF